MITKLRIPLKEQYSYLESEVETETIEEAYEIYQQTVQWINCDGVDEKTMDLFVENQISGQGNSADVFAEMNPQQQREVQRIKRAIARLRNRANNVK